MLHMCEPFLSFRSSYMIGIFLPIAYRTFSSSPHVGTFFRSQRHRSMYTYGLIHTSLAGYFLEMDILYIADDPLE